LAVNEAKSPGGAPIVIKKYANRRLYNTATSTYVTLEDLSHMVREGTDFTVCDAKTGEDITRTVLTQIIFEEEGKGTTLLPINFLRQLIRFYGDSMQKLVPSYLEFSLDSLTKQQEQYRRRFASAFGTAAFDAMQEQVRKNFETFERALGMFTPFSGAEAPDVLGAPEAEVQKAKPQNAKPSEDDIDTLKAELLAMQQRLERLSRS
jgi:polyhydroxyalkanoate synthesis repressor PhaR